MEGVHWLAMNGFYPTLVVMIKKGIVAEEKIIVKLENMSSC